MRKILIIIGVLVVSIMFFGCSKGNDAKEVTNTSEQATSKIEPAKLDEFNKIIAEADNLVKEGKIGTAYSRVKTMDTIKFSEQYFQDKIKEKLSEYNKQIEGENKSIKEDNFKYASELFNSGYYIQAKKWFGYSTNDKSNEEVNQMIEKCTSLIKEKGDNNFYEAKNLFNNGEYKSAFYKMKSISESEDKNYEEAKSLIDEYRRKAEPLYLQQAEEMYNSGNYYEASQFLQGVFEDFQYKVSMDFSKVQSKISKKIESAIASEKRQNAKSPSIGMSEEQVKESTWGYPLYINRTTTAYGNSEQWVYSRYRYIYLDNGKVTAIQDQR